MTSRSPDHHIADHDHCFLPLSPCFHSASQTFTGHDDFLATLGKRKSRPSISSISSMAATLPCFELPRSYGR